MYNWTSSLIASSCTLATCAVGLALARPDALPPPPIQDRAAQSPEAIATKHAMPPRTRLSHASTPPVSYTNTLSSPTQKHRPDTSPSRPSYDGHTWSGKVRRLTGGDATSQRRNDHDRSSTPGSDAIVPDTKSRPLTARSRSRNSFMLKRWSTASYDNSRSSSPWPEQLALSPSSNASATISNAGSHIPMIGTVSMPQERNRLVKRTLSQRHISGLTTKAPTLRRPATSHQRSAELEYWSRSHQRDSMSMTPDTIPREVVTPQAEAKWKSFFSVKVHKKNSPTRNPDAPSGNFRRVIPDEGYFPTLVSTKAIVTSDLDVDHYQDYDGDSVFFSSRPPSAFGVDQALAQARLSAAVKPPVAPRNHDSPRASIERTEQEDSARHSFPSLLSRKPSRTGRFREAVTNKLTRRVSRRVVSEPATLAISRFETRASDRNSFTEARKSQSTSHLSQTDTTSHKNARLPLASDASTTTTVDILQAPHVIHDNNFVNKSAPSNNDTKFSPFQVPHATSERPSSKADSDDCMAEYEAGAATHGHYAIMSGERLRASRAFRNRRISEPRFEPIPDASPTKHNSPQLNTVLAAGTELDVTDTIEEESYMGSPSKTIRSDRADNGSPYTSKTMNRSLSPRAEHLPSSPPEFAKPLNLGSLEYDDLSQDEDEESRWSGVDEQEPTKSPSDVEDWDIDEQVTTPVPLRRSSPFAVELPPGSRSNTRSMHHSSERNGTKTTLFSYSEKAIENPNGDYTPPRPKTVHGKKDADSRGSRANTRGMPGGLHIRSQSVPVVPDLTGKRQTVITNKFGTWGVGSKGVTEDWDEDFDFGDMAQSSTNTNGHEEKRTDSMQPMAIPQKIKEHQISVMNNISLVREFGLMIEELKILKPRATSLGLVEQATDDLYELVDSMIELADQEADATNQHGSPPSSPGLDMSGFDDPPATRNGKKLGRVGSSNDRHDTVIRTPPATKVKRKTVLPDENDVFTSPTTQAELAKPESTSRPRKDSEAMARSVIEALKNKKSDVEASMSLQPIPLTRRVQFDTRTLRHIVPYVSGLVRRVKEQIREAEHLNTDSASDWDVEIEPRVPHLAHVFKDPSPIPESPSSRKSRQSPKRGSPPLDEVSNKLKMMTVV